MSEIRELLRQHFPQLNEPAFLDACEKVAVIKEMEVGETLMNIGNQIRYIPLLCKGLVKIFREDADGHELFLYYIEPGESCAISFVCSFRERISEIRAETSEKCQFLFIPVEYMDPWMQDYKCWYYYVLETYRLRFEEMLKTIDSIAFHKMDERLLEYLETNTKATGTKLLNITHQDIAYELNTSREVISRLLKKLEQRGHIKLGRHQIEVLNLGK